MPLDRSAFNCRFKFRHALGPDLQQNFQAPVHVGHDGGIRIAINFGFLCADKHAPEAVFNGSVNALTGRCPKNLILRMATHLAPAEKGHVSCLERGLSWQLSPLWQPRPL